MKALIISANNFEESELLVPYYRLKEVGVEVTVASLARGNITGKHGYEVAVDKTTRPCQWSGASNNSIFPGRNAVKPTLPVPIHSVPSRSSCRERIQSLGNPPDWVKCKTARLGKNR